MALVESGGLLDLLSRVRRRYLSNLACEQGAWAASMGLCGFILLLLLGTQILDWYWPAILFVGCATFGIVRIVRNMPTGYRLAQGIDRQLELHDSLSTAFHFRHVGGSRGPAEDIRLAQQVQAENLARRIDPRAAIPLTMPRAALGTVLLALVAAAVFGVRYGVTRSLDLRPPLARGIFDVFRGSYPLRASAEKPAPAKKPLEQLPEAAAAAVGTETVKPEVSQENPAPGHETSDLPMDRSSSEPNARSKEAADTDIEPVEPNEQGERSSEGASPDSGEQASRAEQARAKDSDKSPKRPPEPPNENSSLLDKMRDAFANLMAKLKIPQRPGEGRQTTAKQSGEPGGNRQQSTLSQKGMPTPSRSSMEGTPTSDQQGDPDAEGGQKSQASQGKTGDKGGDNQQSREARSGIGKQDGSKDLKEAEQLAAMGKISEILGRRAANLTGEVMVEVSSNKQQALKTPYSQSAASHAESGGEIHRDEVPLVFQQYVQQYFEEVRKNPPPPPPKAAGANGMAR